MKIRKYRKKVTSFNRSHWKHTVIEPTVNLAGKHVRMIVKEYANGKEKLVRIEDLNGKKLTYTSWKMTI